MTVEELVEMLMPMDPNAQVVVYSAIDEGFDHAHSVVVQDRDKPEEFLYCKADHPLDERYGWMPEDVKQVVCIR